MIKRYVLLVCMLFLFYAVDVHAAVLPCTDTDGDGFYAEGGTCGPIDCIENDPAAYPGAPEVCDNIDNNCNGVGDEVDSDNDGVNDCRADRCLNSKPENIVLKPDHYAQIDGAGAFEVGFYHDQSVIYTMETTYGCTCSQIAVLLGMDASSITRGCSQSIMERFTGKSAKIDRQDGIGQLRWWLTGGAVAERSTDNADVAAISILGIVSLVGLLALFFKSKVDSTLYADK